MTKQLVVLGSSSSEIFDYIFGDNQDYFPFWASGWSARGLRGLYESGISELLQTILKDIDKDANILLNFGNVDIDFHLPFKVKEEGFYDFQSLLYESVDGLTCLYEFLTAEMGFKNVYAIFAAPPVRLHNDYWWRECQSEPAPSKSRGRMMLDLVNEMTRRMPVINCLPDLMESPENPICAEQYVRVVPDHHIDYIQAQDVVFAHLQKVEGMLPRRSEKHTSLYEHLNYGIGEVKDTMKPRPRTTR